MLFMNHKPDETVVQLSEVSKHFKDVVAVDRVSLRLEKGTYLALLGPNGAGKTLLNLLVGVRSSGSCLLARIPGVILRTS
mgnify:CR=1 FL=1